MAATVEYLKGNEMAATVEYFMGFSNSMEMLNRYVFAVDRLVGARIWLFDDKFELLAASNINTDYKQDGTRPGIKDLTMLEVCCRNCQGNKKRQAGYQSNNHFKGCIQR